MGGRAWGKLKRNEFEVLVLVAFAALVPTVFATPERRDLNNEIYTVVLHSE